MRTIQQRVNSKAISKHIQYWQGVMLSDPARAVRANKVIQQFLDLRNWAAQQGVLI